MKQLHLDPETRAAERRADLQREIQTSAVSLGWAPEDVDIFCLETFETPFLHLDAHQLGWLLSKFKGVAAVVATVPK